MKSDRLLTLATLLALLGGCATAPREAAPPVRQVQADPFAGFERTRNEETALMEKARLEIIALLSSSPGARQITVEPLQYASLEVTDLRSQQRRSFRVASHFAISMPLAIKKQPAYEQCTEKCGNWRSISPIPGRQRRSCSSTTIPTPGRRKSIWKTVWPTHPAAIRSA